MNGKGGHAGMGLIPALAGKTRRPTDHDTESSAHPRAGGENSSRPLPRTRLFGSSPRWRGKPGTGHQAPQPRWLIPALAGKTYRTVSARPHTMAHPRAGGENAGEHFASVLVSGSSPRWRGKRSSTSLASTGLRLIPALAGKTMKKASTTEPTTAHPRAGGENREFRAVDRAIAGSSPRWRGKRRRA